MITAVWILLGIAAVAGAIALIGSRQRSGGGGSGRDLGTVSSQWISEHRLGSNQDYSRR